MQPQKLNSALLDALVKNNQARVDLLFNKIQKNQMPLDVDQIEQKIRSYNGLYVSFGDQYIIDFMRAEGTVAYLNRSCSAAKLQQLQKVLVQLFEEYSQPRKRLR